jgi:hypothetical protein
MHTMLHELCHNVHSNHSVEFYSLLDELKSEYDAQKRNGVTKPIFTGEGRTLGGGGSLKVAPKSVGGFATSGHTLGGSASVPHNIPRTQAGIAAMKRSKTDVRAASSDSLRERMARAAEKRKQDDHACGSIIDGHANDWEGDVETLETNKGESKCGRKSLEDEWPCPRCTLLNSANLIVCALCDCPRSFERYNDDCDFDTDKGKSVEVIDLTEDAKKEWSVSNIYISVTFFLF